MLSIPPTALDLFRQGAALLGASGEFRFANLVLRRWLRTTAEAPLLVQEIRRVAARLLRRANETEIQDPVCPRAGYGVHIGRRRYRLRGALLPPSVPGEPPLALVIVGPGSRPVPPDAVLRTRFGLTPQESRIARLLARRRTNTEIAQALFISPRTARTHTEHVLRKLGIRSRMEVRTAIESEVLSRETFSASQIRTFDR